MSWKPPVIPPREVPVIPAREPWGPTTPETPNPTVAICGACNLELKEVMGYVCNRRDCPVWSNHTC